MGQDGYRHAAGAIMNTAEFVKEGIRSTPELEILGEPLWVIAFTSKTRNIFDVMERMSHKGWRLNGLHRPSCVHICLTLLHTKPGVAERFIADLREATAQASRAGKKGAGMAPVYGMAAQIPLRGVLGKFLKKYIDKLYEV
jgi:glutamate/tyrosine decarboxylase-like PLP-dependent enzyme